MLVLLLVALVILAPSCRYLKQKLGLGEYSLKAAIEWAKRDSTRVADSLKRIMEDKRAFERALTDTIMSIEVNNPAEKPARKSYYIICGSFSSHENAVKVVSQYKSYGYQPLIIKSSSRDGSPLELVSVRKFTDPEAAGNFLAEFKQKHDPGAWVYSGK